MKFILFLWLHLVLHLTNKEIFSKNDCGSIDKYLKYSIIYIVY